jgi:hypothetical protein
MAPPLGPLPTGSVATTDYWPYQSCRAPPLLLRRGQEPQHGGNEQQGGYVSNKVASLMFVIDRLYCHDAGMQDARPDGERDQAPVF